MSDGKIIESQIENNHIGDINMIQYELAMAWDKDVLDENQKFIDWADLYSKEFRRIIDLEINEDKDFWENFKDEEFKKELINRIKERLYFSDEDTEESMREAA